MRSTILFLATASFALSSCGGGGGSVNSTPTPTSTPVTPPSEPVTPTPMPDPTPDPAPTSTNYDTGEYERSTGVVQAHAIAAYQAGATGAGITAAIIDSGIATGSSYFTGRISTASQDVAGNRGIDDTAGHGTAVAAVLGAARDGNDILGMAFDATLLVLRTDSPGSCASTKGCQHDDGDIARAVDIATADHARVINISLGGSPASATLRSAIGRATAAGIVIVISAGNDGTANPDPLALIANDSAANGLVIIAGATTTDGTAASFSDKAGTGAAHYLDALGDDVPSIDQTGTRYLYSGTSFSAPHIAGAIALLAQAFPNLTGAQLVSLLFRSATDAGTPGVDGVYGNGVLNLTAAFSPQGSLSLAGRSRARVSLADNGSLSAPMGDAMTGNRQHGMGAVILDSYDRAFALDLARTIGRAPPALRLSGQLRTDARDLSMAGGGAMVALSIVGRQDGGAAIGRLALDEPTAERAQLSAGMVATRLGRTGAVAFGIADDGKTLSARLAGRSDPAFVIAPDILGDPGFARRAGASAAYRRQFGRFGLTMTGETGDATSYVARDILPGRPALIRNPYSALTFGLDRRVGPVSLTLAASRMDESDSVLGARFGDALGGGGATSWFLDSEGGVTAPGGWSATLRARRGWTQVAASGVMSRDGRLTTSAYSFDVAKAGVIRRDDSVALRVAQPLRVASGGFDLNLPVSYDYADLAVGYAPQRLGLAPTGREIDLEAVYGRPLFGGWVNTNLFWRRDPGNVAALPDDRGAAMRFTVGF